MKSLIAKAVKRFVPSIEDNPTFSDPAMEGVTEVARSSNFSVGSIDTVEAAKALTRKYHHTFRYSNEFERHKSIGKLFVIQDGKDRFFAHPGFGLMDYKGEAVPLDKAQQILKQIPANVVESNRDLSVAVGYATWAIASSNISSAPAAQPSQNSGLEGVNGVTTLMSGSNLSVGTVDTVGAAKELTRSFHIGFRYPNEFKRYKDAGEIYVIQEGENQYFAHPGAGMVDDRDRPVPPEKARQILSQIPAHVIESNKDLATVVGIFNREPQSVQSGPLSESQPEAKSKSQLSM